MTGDNERNKRIPFSDQPSSEEYSSLEQSRADLDTARKKAEEGKRVLSSNKAVNVWMRYSGLGMQAGLMMALPVLGGYYADTKWGSSPWGVVGGAFLGVFGAMYTVIRFVNKVEREAKLEKERQGQ